MNSSTKTENDSTAPAAQTTSATTQTPAPKIAIPINTIILHQQPHLDEVVAVTILRMYGEALFPGIGKAQLRFVEADIVGIESEWDKNGELPIGVCKGRFDEHRDGIKNGRIKGKCAATLAAKYLGIENRPELKKLLAETLEGDMNATNTPTQLAELMKVGYRSLKKDSYVVFSTVSTAVIAIINLERLRYAQNSDEKSLKVMWAEALQADEELKAMQRVVSRIGQLVGESAKNEGNLVTEFSFVIKALFRAPHDYKKVVEPQFEFYLACLKNDIVEFQAVIEELKKVKPVEVRALLYNRKDIIKLLVCKSDALQASKAARMLGNHIVLVRNSEGNFQIFTDKRVFNDQGLSLANLVRMIRWLSLPADQKAKADWQALGCAGDHPDVEGIHYHKVAEAVYNGSLTHPAKASTIAMQALIEAIKYAFDPGYVKMWCNDRCIIMNPKKVAQIKAAMREEKHRNKSEEKTPAQLIPDLAAVLENVGAEKSEERPEKTVRRF